MRVAIWMQGGIGGGNFSQGYPPLLNFVVKLSAYHELTVYSILPANKDFVPEGFTFRTIHRSIKARKVRTVLICFLFLWDHIVTPYTLLHAFWVYPAGTIAVILGKLTGIKSIVTIQGGEAAALPEINYGNMLKPHLKKITLWTCEQATCLNSISKFLIHEMGKHGLKRKDAVVIPFGAEKNLFSYTPKEFMAVLKIIHVANLTEVKDQQTLLKAFAGIVKQIPAELRIIGGDFLNGQLQRLSQDLGLQHHVKFMGSMLASQLPGQYEWADIMLHTSLHEGQSGVVMEAMASGVVICGTCVGIIYDLGDAYFEIAGVRDYNALCNKVLMLRNNMERHHKLKEKSLAYADEFDANWTVRMFNELYIGTTATYLKT